MKLYSVIANTPEYHIGYYLDADVAAGSRRCVIWLGLHNIHNYTSIVGNVGF